MRRSASGFLGSARTPATAGAPHRRRPRPGHSRAHRPGGITAKSVVPATLRSWTPATRRPSDARCSMRSPADRRAQAALAQRRSSGASHTGDLDPAHEHDDVAGKHRQGGAGHTDKERSHFAGLPIALEQQQEARRGGGSRGSRREVETEQVGDSRDRGPERGLDAAASVEKGPPRPRARRWSRRFRPPATVRAILACRGVSARRRAPPRSTGRV